MTSISSSRQSVAGSTWSSKAEPSVETILNNERYNGRINILDDSDPTIRFQMAEKIATRNRATEYRQPLEGILEDNVLSQVYFSEGNIQILQNGLRAGVYYMSGDQKLVIPPQNVDNLKVIMRSIFLQYGQFKEQLTITQQVERLNEIVLDYAVQNVYNEAIGYLKYCQDQSSLAMPMARPQPTDRDHKHLEIKQWF
jgi:hypothetical protein